MSVSQRQTPVNVAVRVSSIVLAAAACGFVLAIVSALTGGFRTHLLGVPVSVRGPERAATVSCILAALGMLLRWPVRERDARFFRTLAVIAPAAITAMATVAVVFVGIRYGGKTAGGADAYGYVSQVPLWRSGDLHIEQPFASQVPWPKADGTLTPLGYMVRPGHTMVPTYSPGIPILMALLVTLFGEGAEYWLTPIAGGALVAFTYLIAARLSGRFTGVLAALCVATSPLVLFLTMGLLGDPPAAAFWLASIWLALRGTRPSVAASGLAAAIAIVIRPNLVPVALAPLSIALWTLPAATLRARTLAALTFGAAVLPAALFIAWLFNDLYGSPLRSGYGESSSLFAVANIPVNLRQFTAWTWEAHGPFPFLFPLALLPDWAGARARRVRISLVAFVLLMLACYIAYIPFDAWWYLRFLLPAIPVMLVLSLDAVMGGGRPSRRAAGAAFAACAIAYSTYVSAEKDVLASGIGERRYQYVAEWIRDETPGRTAVFAMQHSGSVRHYSGRLTIRYDYLEPVWLDRCVEYLKEQGYAVYAVLDDDEVPIFARRFRTQRFIAGIEDESRLEFRTGRAEVYLLER